MKLTKILVVAVLAMLGMAAEAQEQIEVQKFEGEFRVGMNYPLHDIYLGGKKTIGFGIGAELRYNLPRTGFDFGFTVEYSSNRFKDIPIYAVGVTESGEKVTTQGTMQANTGMGSLLLLSDYNFRQGHKINPYVGMGFGLSIRGENEGGPVGVGFKVRGGVEFIHLLRLGLEVNITQIYHNNVMLTLGIAIGGRPKK